MGAERTGRGSIINEMFVKLEKMENKIKYIIKRCRRVPHWSLFICWGFLILSSCASDEYIPKTETETELDKGYFSLSANTGKLLITRSFDGYDEGTLNERYVKAVRVVLYDGLDGTDQSQVKYAFDYKIESDQGAQYWKDNSTEKKDLSPVRNKFTATNFVTYAREVEVQPYRMLVIINPTKNSDPQLDLYKLTAVGNRLANLKTSIEIDPALMRTQGTNIENLDAGIAADRYFLMMNDQGLIDVPAHWIQDTKNRAHQLPIPAYVDRVVSKVTLLPSDINDIAMLKSGAKISDLSWALDIVNKKTFWMRQITNTYQNTGGLGPSEIVRVHPPGESIPTTPGTDRKDRYAVDPNYEGLNGTSSAAVNERKANFYSCGYLAPFPSCLDKILGDRMYCLENTMNLDHQFSEVSTRALIRCVYTPKNIANGEGYYLFNDETIISLNEMKEYVRIIHGDKGEVWKSGPYKEMYFAIQEAMVLYTLDAIPDLSFFFRSTEGSTLKYYNKGVNFYAIKLRHFDYGSTTPDNEYGYYGLVRNTHYKVIITEVKGPGEPLASQLEYKTRSENDAVQSNLYNLNVTFDRDN